MPFPVIDTGLIKTLFGFFDTPVRKLWGKNRANYIFIL